MPVNETIELVERARAELTVPLGAVIVNRVLPELFTHADEDTFDALREPDAPTRSSTDARRIRARRAVLDARPPRGRRCAGPAPSHLGRLRDAGRPADALPAVPVRARPGLRVTRMVADALAQELGL